MAKRREQPSPPRIVAAPGRRLFRRRLRRCIRCDAPSSWSLEDAGPLCDAHLVAEGVDVPLGGR